jgi:hypothetical protein
MSFSHLSPVRRTAIALRDHAVQYEVAGRFAAGVQIRHDLIQVGARVRNQSHASFSSLVGMQVERIAIARPGGSAEIKASDGKSDEAMAKERIDRYTSFLIRSNQSPAEARWVREREAAGTQAYAIIRNEQWKVDPLLDFMPFGYLWGTSLIVFWGIAGFLTLAGAASGISRLSFVRNSRPLPAAGRWGFWLGIIVFPIGVGIRHLGAPRGATTVAAEIACVIAIGLGLARKQASLWQTAVVAAAVFFDICYLPKGIVNGQMSLLALTCLFGHRTGEPVVAGTVRTMRGIGPPMVAFAILIYSAAAYSAGVHYRAGSVDLPRLMRDESRVYAAALHQRWPE